MFWSVYICAGVYISFIKKETLTQVFSCEFCEISENAFSYRIAPLAASERVIWFWDKGLRERERWVVEREKSTAVDRNSTVLQYPTLMWWSRRDHSINVSDDIYGCLSGLSCRCFCLFGLSCRCIFKVMNFSDRFRQCFKLFYSFEK